MHISLFFLQTVYPYIQLFELQVCSLKSVSQSVSHPYNSVAHKTAFSLKCTWQKCKFNGLAMTCSEHIQAHLLQKQCSVDNENKNVNKTLKTIQQVIAVPEQVD